MIDLILILASIVVSGFIMTTSDWRWRLVGLSLVNLIAFLFIVQIWPIALATIKLISGWIGVVLLGASLLTNDEFNIHGSVSSYRIFKVTLVALVVVVIFILVQRLNVWLPISITFLFGGLVVFLTGILFVSVHHQMIEVIFGMLILLAGFDIIYSSLEGSTLVTGIYAVIVLMLSLLGRYFSIGFDSRSDQ